LPIWVDAFLNGVVWTGASLGLWNLLLDLADDPSHRESYFAIYSVVTGLCAFVASLLSGIIAQALHSFRLTLFGFHFVNYDVLFLFAGQRRFAGLPLLLRVQERGSKSVRHTVRAVSALGVWRINRGKGMLLDALGFRSRGQP
jgi:cyanate permease